MLIQSLLLITAKTTFSILSPTHYPLHLRLLYRVVYCCLYCYSLFVMHSYNSWLILCFSYCTFDHIMNYADTLNVNAGFINCIFDFVLLYRMNFSTSLLKTALILLSLLSLCFSVSLDLVWFRRTNEWIRTDMAVVTKQDMLGLII